MVGMITAQLSYALMIIISFGTIWLASIYQTSIQHSIQVNWTVSEPYRYCGWAALEATLKGWMILTLAGAEVLLWQVYKPITDGGVVWATADFVGYIILVLLGGKYYQQTVITHAINCKQSNPDAKIPLTVSCVAAIIIMILHITAYGVILLRI